MTELTLWDKYVAIQKRIGNIIVDKKAGNIIYNNGVVCLTYSRSYPINKSTIVKYEFKRGDGKEYKSSYAAFLNEFKNIFSPNGEIEIEYNKLVDVELRDKINYLWEKMRDKLLSSGDWQVTDKVNSHLEKKCSPDMNDILSLNWELCKEDNIPIPTSDITFSGIDNNNNRYVKPGKKKFFIAVDGGDAVGKTTICNFINTAIKILGYDTEMALGHAHGEFGQLVRNTILNPLTADVSHTTQLLLFAANRRHIYENVVLPALNNDRIAIVDRWHLTSYAYQSDAYNFDQILDSSINCIPDLNIVLLADREVSRKRVSDRGESSDHLEKRAIDNADTLNNRFRQGALSGKYAKKTVIIDANNDLDIVKAEVTIAIINALNQKEI